MAFENQNSDSIVDELSVSSTNASVAIEGTFYVFLVPDQVIARITSEPRLPAIPIALQFGPGFSLNGEATYKSFIDYTEHGKSDISHTVSSHTPSLSFSIDFGAIIQGGTFHLEMMVPWHHTSWETDVQQFRGISNIRGINPSKPEVKSRLGDIALQITAYRESRFRQFGDDQLPLFGPQTASA